MPAVDYAVLAARTKVEIDANGRSVQLARHNTTALNPLQPWRGGVVTPLDIVPIDIIAIFAGLSGGDRASLSARLEREGVKRREFAKATTSAVGLNTADIRNYDVILDGPTEIWTIEEFSAIEPASIPIVFVFTLSR